MTPRNRRNRRNNGGPDDDATQWLTPLITDPADGTTVQFAGASIIGLPYDVTVIQAGPAPAAGYRPAPASFPAQPPAAAAPAPASVENTEPAVIGDSLRLPVIWCDMPRCISWFGDPASAGYADTRDRAAAAGWRTDAHDRLACPPCQQTRADYRTPQPVTVQHPGIPRRWHEHGTLPSEDTQDRLTAAADYARYVRRAHPEWAAAMADASDRTAAS